MNEPEFKSYLRQLPTCPAAQRDTYSGGYEIGGCVFTVSCQGDNHRNFLAGSETANSPYEHYEGLLLSHP